LYRLNREQRTTAEEIDLVPDLDDPKDLFGRLEYVGTVGTAAPGRWPAPETLRATANATASLVNS